MEIADLQLNELGEELREVAKGDECEDVSTVAFGYLYLLLLPQGGEKGVRADMAGRERRQFDPFG